MNTGSMSAKTACDVAVIGGGAAGMMAALQAALGGRARGTAGKERKTGQENLYHGQRTLQRDQRCGHR